MLAKSNTIVNILDSAGELTVEEIARRASEPVSSTYRLVTNLLQIGWISKGSRRGLYRLGLFFMRIGSAVEDQMDLRSAARPALKHLLEETGATSYLCIRRGTRAVCIERLDGIGVRPLAMQLGDSLPLWVGAGPMAILAFLPKSERDGLIGELERSGEMPASKSDLLKTVGQVRERGYAISDEGVTLGIAAVGVPVYNHRGEPEAAISVIGLRLQLLGDLAVTARLVLAAAAETSAALGYAHEDAAR